MGYPRENILAGSGILGVESRKWVENIWIN